MATPRNPFRRAVPNNQHLAPIRAVYTSRYTDNKLKAWKDGNLARLLGLIDYGESNNSPESGSSGLRLHNDWKIHSRILLAQREPLFLTSLLDRTLPQRALRGEFGNRLPNIRKHDPDGPLQPLIYVNIIADSLGCGLTCDEFDHTLAALEVGVELRTDPATGGSITIKNGVQQAYKAAKPQSNKNFWAGVDEPKLKENVKRFVAENRSILAAARAAGMDHLMFHPEVGWGYKGYNRMHNHKNLDESSIDIFRYLQLVLRHLYPTRGFRLHQFIWFDVLKDSQAVIGEAIGSQLAESYITYGGVNFKQAGVSVTQTWKLDGKQWDDVCKAIGTNNYQRILMGNLQTMYDRASDRAERRRDLVERHVLQAELAQLKEALEEDLERLRELIYGTNRDVIDYEQNLRELEQDVADFNTEEAGLREIDQDLHELAEREGVIIPASCQQPRI